MRKKDVVLLATVTSFEALHHPGKTDLKQFSELFPPLFSASSAEARRQAAAALSQCPVVPDTVALFLGRQPIDIAAIFLTSAVSISDDVLMAIASSEGEAHARAIARRNQLSPAVLDVLVGLRHQRQTRINSKPASAAVIRPQGEAMVSPETPMSRMEEEYRMEDESLKQSPAAIVGNEAERLDREEKLRQGIKDLARHLNPPENDRQGMRHIQPVELALFARFARSGEIGLFTTALSYALSCTRWLAERILLDMSGLQLATTLVSLGMPDQEAADVLTGIYPHLATRDGHGTRAESLLESLDQRECDLRVDSWLRADTYSFPSANADKASPLRKFRR